MCLEEYCRVSPVHWCHVPAHCGRLWNEAVDTLANFALSYVTPSEPAWLDAFSRFDSNVRAWLWMVKPLVLRAPLLPELCCRTLLHRFSLTMPNCALYSVSNLCGDPISARARFPPVFRPLPFLRPDKIRACSYLRRSRPTLWPYKKLDTSVCFPKTIAGTMSLDMRVMPMTILGYSCG